MSYCCDLDAGVLLFLEYDVDSSSGRSLPNNSLISASSLDFRYGLACYSADSSTDTIGEWRFPDGNKVEVETLNQEQAVFAHNQIGRVTLQLRTVHQFTSNLEGVYTCLIPDEFGTERALHAGVYSASGYANSGACP